MFKGFKYFFKMCWQLNHNYIYLLVVKQVLSIIISLGTLIGPQIIIDSIFTYGSRQDAYISISTFILLIFILSFIMNYVSNRLLIERMLTYKEFQIYLSKKLSSVKFEILESKEYLDLKSKAEKYLYGSGEGFGTILDKCFDIIGKLVTLLGIVGILSKLSIIIVIIIICVVLANSIYNFKVQNINIDLNIKKAIVERRSSYFANLFQDFNYGKEIRVFNLNNWLLLKYDSVLTEMQEFYKKLSKNNYNLSNFSLLFSTIQQIASYVFVVVKSFEGEVSIGQFSMYIQSIGTLSSGLKDIIYSLIEIQQYGLYYIAFKEYINLPEIEEMSGKLINDTKEIEIEFEDVWFKYNNQNDYAIKSLNIVITKGENISVVGMNGAGKSTFIKLLLRLYKPTKGRILLNGKDIEEINYLDYMKLFSTVFQDSKLFSLSFKDNLVLSEQYDADRLNLTLGKMNLNRILKKMTKDIDTTIYRDFDDLGFTPSGGEAQRISIARAFYKAAEIVVLDEPTSALDPQAEYDLYQKFTDLYKNKTSIFISHRLASARNASKILVFDKGHLVENGTHEELLDSKGVYSRLFNLQSEYYK